MPAYARTVLLALCGLVLVAGAPPAGPPPPPAPAATAAPAAPPAFTSARTYPAVAPPVRLRIPSLGVDSALDRLGRQADGTVEVPERTGVAGWYATGPRPGQPGPAVILGHVDSRTGPGVFARLRTAPPGTVVRVDRADGTSARFRITEIVRVPKDRFPTDLVYAPTLDATLRLVTCGGSFDRDRESYRDNVIAFADLL